MNEKLLEIIDIDQEGRGVAKRDEKTFFIHNALIGEQVEFQSLKKKKNIFSELQQKYSTILKIGANLFVRLTIDAVAAQCSTLVIQHK